MHDKLSQLPDELLLKVLLFLPTKVAASTSILSKRWGFLWMWLPKLEYNDCSSSTSGSENLSRFINFNLPIHRAPVIESLRLNCSHQHTIKPEDFRLCVLIAVSRSVRELSLNLYPWLDDPFTKLPTSLYTCKSLIILELKEKIIVDVPRMSCLPCLKTLRLQRVVYANKKSLHKLLSSCPVLEELFVELDLFDDSGTLSVIVPSLQKLTLKIGRGYYFKRLVLNTPSLKYFNVTDYIAECDDDDYSESGYDPFDFEYMPKLEEVEVDSTYPGIDNIVSSITYIKRLSLCLRVRAEEALYREGIVFNQLQHLKLCSCAITWSKSLVRLLNDSPNLRELEISLNYDHSDRCVDSLVCWENQLDSVPTCVLSSLETFMWRDIYGSQKEIDLVKYILRNARCLKTATIVFWKPNSPEEEDEREMLIQDLSLSFRGSKHAKLVFV